MEILTEPKNALRRAVPADVRARRRRTEFEPDALEAVADLAVERGTGARGLRAIIEETLQPVMFDLPSREDIASVVITADAVLNKTEPTLISHDVVAKRRNKSA